jgi:hypothetical protein
LLVSATSTKEHLAEASAAAPEAKLHHEFEELFART